jgi:hypothetical protein
MSEQFDQYPLVQKAYNKLEEFSAKVGVPVSPHFNDFITRAVNTADTYLDGSATDKQNVIVACIMGAILPVLFFNPDSAGPVLRSFATDYTPEVKEVVDLIAFGDDAAALRNPLLAQAGALTSLTALQIATDRFKAGELSADTVRAALQESAQRIADGPRDVLAATAPRLEAFFQNTITSGLAAVENQPSSSATKKKSNGPKF